MTEPGELARDDDLAIRRMRDDLDDYERFVRWRNEPHVARWWNTDEDTEPLSVDRVIEKYGPRTEDASWVTACLISLADRPIGYAQVYPWSEVGEEAREMGIPPTEGLFGLDIFIGEPDAVGRGIGSRAVALLARYLFEERGAAGVALLTAVDNVRAQRAYEKAGMRKVKQTLDTDTVDGRRVVSWLMIVDRPLR